MRTIRYSHIVQIAFGGTTQSHLCLKACGAVYKELPEHDFGCKMVSVFRGDSSKHAGTARIREKSCTFLLASENVEHTI
jgi:hypothetical protein